MPEDEPIPSIYKTPKSVKTLRAYYKDRLSLPDIIQINNELTGISARAAIILMAAILDDLLTFRLAQSIAVPLNDDDMERAFRFEGPIGGFSHKIEIAYLFGAIDLNTYNELNVIREMRNACAHSSYTLNFAKPELANVVKRLFEPYGAVKLPRDTPEDIKSAFVTAGIFLIQTLALGSRAAAAQEVEQELRRLAAQEPPSPDTHLQR